MSWAWLFIAGLLEITFATFLKLSDGFTKIPYVIGFIIAAFLSFYSLTKAMETISLGTSYAVWTGIGSLGTIIIGILYFNEPVSFWRCFFLLTLVLSIFGLKLSS